VTWVQAIVEKGIGYTLYDKNQIRSMQVCRDKSSNEIAAKVALTTQLTMFL